MGNLLLTIKDLKISKAGYLVTNDKNETPVYHAEFVAEQQEANFRVLLAAATKGKTFSAGKTDDLAAIVAQVRASIGNNTKTYVAAPAKPKSTVLDTIIAEQLALAGYHTDNDKVSRVNAEMQAYNAVATVEEVGDYFTEKAVRLSAIYDIATITAAVTSTLDLNV